MYIYIYIYIYIHTHTHTHIICIYIVHFSSFIILPYWMFFLSNLMKGSAVIQKPSVQIPKVFNQHEITEKTNRDVYKCFNIANWIACLYTINTLNCVC